MEKGALEVTSSIASARIFIDNADTGKTTPATITDLTVGGHDVDVKLTNFVTLKVTPLVTVGTTPVKIVMARDVTGKWKALNEGGVVLRAWIQESRPGELWVHGLEPANFKVDGYNLTLGPTSSGTYANGTISADGKRIEIDYYNQGTNYERLVFEKVS